MNSGIIRWTNQLMTILDIVYSNKHYLQADEIHQKARLSLPNISLGTVYRNLNKLVEGGLIISVSWDNAQVFGKHPFTNAHMQCIKCGRLFPVHFDIDMNALSRDLGVEIATWELKLKGVCMECEE